MFFISYYHIMILWQFPLTNEEIEKVKNILDKWNEIINTEKFVQWIKAILAWVTSNNNITSYDKVERPHLEGKRDAYSNQELLSALTWNVSHHEAYSPWKVFDRAIVKCACEDILEELQITD